MIILTAATKQEIDGISRCIGKKMRVASEGFGLWEGAYKGKDVLVIQTGIGRSRVESALSHVLSDYRATALISLGFGGALSKELVAGDVVLCNTVHYRDGQGGDPEVQPQIMNAYLFQRAAEVLSRSKLTWLQGSGVTVLNPASRAGEKQVLRDRFQAEVCEMEDYWIADVAKTHQTPFLAVRVIYDEAQMRLPDFERLVDAEGNLKLGRAIPYLLSHPAQLFKAPALYQRSNRAQNSLSIFVSKFLDIL